MSKPNERWQAAHLIHDLENEIFWLECHEALFEDFEVVRQQLIERNYERLRRLETLYGMFKERDRA